MTKEMSILVIVAITGFSIWPGQSVSAQDLKGNMDSSGYSRRGIPGGLRLKNVGENAMTKEQREQINILKYDEVKQMNALRVDKSLSKELKMEKVRQIREVSEEKIKVLLTSGQLKEYEEVSEKKRAFRDKLRHGEKQKTQPG